MTAAAAALRGVLYPKLQRQPVGCLCSTSTNELLRATLAHGAAATLVLSKAYLPRARMIFIWGNCTSPRLVNYNPACSPLSCILKSSCNGFCLGSVLTGAEVSKTRRAKLLNNMSLRGLLGKNDVESDRSN